MEITDNNRGFQQYETEESISLEEDTRRKIARYMQKGIIKNPKLYSVIDCQIVNNLQEKRCEGVIEIKCREINFGDFDTLFISADKIRRGRQYECLGLEFWLGFRFLNGDIYLYKYIDIRSEMYFIADSGRTSKENFRPESIADRELVAHFPMNRYKHKIENVKESVNG